MESAAESSENDDYNHHHETEPSKSNLHIEQRDVRLNGFNLPLNRYQLASWIVFIIGIMIFIFILVPANFRVSEPL